METKLSEKQEFIKNIIETKDEKVNRVFNHADLNIVTHYGSLFITAEELEKTLYDTEYELIELYSLDECNSDLIIEGQVNQILIDIDFLNNFIVKSKVKKGKFKKSL